MNNKEIAKKLSKKFACSASAVGKDSIEMQGDVGEEVITFMVEQFKVC